MEIRSPRPAWWRHPWRWYWGAWGFIGLYMASMDWVRATPGAIALEGNLVQYGVWGLLGLGILLLVRRFPLSGSRRALGWGIHVGASLAFTALALVPIHFAWASVIHQHLITPFTPGQWDYFLESYPYQFHIAWLMYWLVVLACHALEAYRRFHARELHASQLEARLSQAQLQALRMQLNPHFLFNTLYAISALMHSDLEAADQMVARLSDFLRLTLEGRSEQEVPLRQELAFVNAYLAIEQVRFQDRLTVDLQVDPTLMDALVPNLVLQPLVENALRHGLSPRAGAGRLSIRAGRDGDRLRLEVEDDGTGLDPARVGRGIGTRNTRDRLQQLYGADQHFELTARPERGTLARILLPLRMEEGPRPGGGKP